MLDYSAEDAMISRECARASGGASSSRRRWRSGRGFAGFRRAKSARYKSEEQAKKSKPIVRRPSLKLNDHLLELEDMEHQWLEHQHPRLGPRISPVQVCAHVHMQCTVLILVLYYSFNSLILVLQNNSKFVLVVVFVCCSFSSVKPLWSSGKTLAANAGGRGFESQRGQNLFFTFYSN